MGGKHKQAQRTKNNARPSSSGRSAELLGTNVPQFVGFSLSKETGLSLPGLSLPSSDDLEKLLDPNFQLVLKKMNKKDSTTKLKALQEFAQLAKNSEPEAVKTVLSFWPRLYNILATDTDHKVREAAHVAHLQVVLKAKRNLAPFLKQLIAPWFTSQYDTYAPAATAASQSFQAAFPPNKIQEAIVFCQEEILSYVVDNLTVQTAQTLSNPKTITTEDAEARYERILISSLQGYSLYLNKVTSENIQNASELNLKLISNSKFWKLAKHNVPPIRAAFYNVLTDICQKAPFLVANEGGRLCNAVFVNLDESDPTVLLGVWETALMVVTSIKDWWTYISVEKLLLPKLFKVLREGGQGNASVIYPNLLPFISELPPTLDKNLFFQNFFENMCLGLKQKNVITSKSESVAVASALIECIRYIALKHQSEIVLCEKIIKSHLISVIEWCLLENQASCKTIFNQTASLVQYWSRHANNNEFCNYSKFLHFFWNNLTSLFQGLLLNLEQSYDADKICQVTERQIELLTSLKHTFKPRKQLKVQFTSESSTETEPAEKRNTTVHSDQSYNDSLNDLIYNVCESYVKIINTKKSKHLLEVLYSLMLDFESENFFLHLSKMVAKDETEGKLINIYNNLLLKWLKCSYLCSKPIVDLIFLVLKYLENSDREQIFNTLCEISDENCLGWTIAEMLSHPHNKDPLVQKWLSNKKVTAFLVSIVDKELSDECSPELSILLKLALTENEFGELLISEEATKIIVEKLIKPLLTPNLYSLTIDACSSLAAYMASIIYTENLLMNYGDDLLMGLFMLSCNDKIDPDILSSDTLWEVNSSWQDALSILAKHLPKEDLQVLVKKLANAVHNQFLSNDLDKGNLTDGIVNCIRAIYKSVPLNINEYLKLFFDCEYILNWKKYINNICVVAEYVKGNLCCPYEKLILSDVKDVGEIDIPKYFIWSYMKIDVLSKCLEENCDNYNDEEDNNSENQSLILKTVDNPENYVLNIMYDLCLGSSYLENFKTVKYYRKIKEYYSLTKDKLKDIIKSKICDISKIELMLKEKINTNAWLWCKCSYIWYSEITINKQKMCEVYEEILKGNTIINSLSVLQLTQTYGKHLTYDYVQQSCGTVESAIVLRSLIHCDEIDVQIAEVFSKIEKLRSQNVPLFLYDCSNIQWNQSQEILEVIRLFTNLMKYKCNSLSRKHWDFGVLSLVSWTTNIVKIKSKFYELEVQSLLVSIAEFYVSIDNCIKDLKENNPNNSFINEWEDLFVQSIHNDLVQLWMYLAEKLESIKGIEAIMYLPLIQEFSTAINNFNYKFIFNNDGTLPKWSKFLKRCFSLLINSNTMLQLWGYKMLLILVPGLVEIDNTAVHTNTPHENGLIFEQFKEVLVRTHEIVNAMLQGFKLSEDSCRVQEFTDSFTYTLAYLLLWDILLTLCEKSSTELRYQYADWLKEEDLLKNLLNNLFKLMPAEILHQVDSKSKALPELFINKPALHIGETCTSETVEHMVCWIYALSLSQLPALVRQWWSGTETKIAQIVERVTTLYVSSQLCARELSDVASNVTPFKNMVIKVIPSVWEVVAVYTVDEAQMELVITLPKNYPLGGPDVQCNRQIGGTSHKQWLMQLKKCVLHQNGRIWDGLNLWNNNLDKKFDGVEECYICFAVLHPGTYQLPKLSCQTCKKKFHSACLYKWFSTSNKSTCPICRNLF